VRRARNLSLSPALVYVGAHKTPRTSNEKSSVNFAARPAGRATADAPRSRTIYERAPRRGGWSVPLNAYLAHKKNTGSFRRRADAETPPGSTRGLRSGQARGGTG